MAFRIGDRVEVVGLVSDSGRELNGQMGSITVQLVGRWGVKLDLGAQKSIRTENLRVVSDCPICMEPLVTHTHGLYTLKCGHQLHEKCMHALRLHGQDIICPLCRSEGNRVTEELYKQACDQQEMKNHQEVMRLLLEILDIDPEHAEANGFLGTIYVGGTPCTPQNHEKAFAHFELAYRHGCIDAGHLLGTLYENGHGTTQNFGKAFKLYEEAHRKGYAYGTLNLGVLYANGRGTPQDFGKALELFEAAHAQGLAQASFHLGVMHMKGDGVPENIEKAINFFETAKRRGHPNAAFVLSTLR